MNFLNVIRTHNAVCDQVNNLSGNIAVLRAPADLQQTATALARHGLTIVKEAKQHGIVAKVSMATGHITVQPN